METGYEAFLPRNRNHQAANPPPPSTRTMPPTTKGQTGTPPFGSVDVAAVVAAEAVPVVVLSSAVSVPVVSPLPLDTASVTVVVLGWLVGFPVAFVVVLTAGGLVVGLTVGSVGESMSSQGESRRCV